MECLGTGKKKKEPASGCSVLFLMDSEVSRAPGPAGAGPCQGLPRGVSPGSVQLCLLSPRLLLAPGCKHPGISMMSSPAGPVIGQTQSRN